ncbi:hypothetical protein GCM10023191_074110 [Actinoallomurus oryzae]|uniref:Uncharacterized protein n=1 Tax=Actinoallomurus oryzae TaxID=502180 RepID=A0ABP8QUM7_9ACTN
MSIRWNPATTKYTTNTTAETTATTPPDHVSTRPVITDIINHPPRSQPIISATPQHQTATGHTPGRVTRTHTHVASLLVQVAAQCEGMASFDANETRNETSNGEGRLS